MKKKHWIWIAVFVVLCILMPFLIEWLYRIGDSFPLIHTIYSASDVLGYVSGVIGLVISMVAIFLSLRAEEHDLGIRHAITVGKNNKEAIEIQIINNSTFDCNIDSVELCNKRQRIYCHIISSPPFTVKAKGHTDFTVEAERIERLFQSMGMRQNRRKAKYCIRLSLNKSVYISAAELVRYLESAKEIAGRAG